MAFGKARKMVRHAKISLRGTLKSGKTTTGAMLAAYIAKKFHPGKPVSFVPTEPGIDFTLNIFAAEGVEVIEPVDAQGIPLRSRDYTILKNAIPEALAAGAGVMLVDNLTHFREDLVRAYKSANKITRKLKPFEYMPINDQWAEFTAQMTAAPLDIIVLGRLGKIFEELENEDGETDIHQIGNKMKAGSDTEYEVDLIAEMESRPDPDLVNAEKIPVLGPPDAQGARKLKRKKLVRRFEQRNIHVFTVAGCRVWALNGQSLIMKSSAAYKKGGCDQVGEFCGPYLDFLKAGGDAGGQALNLGSRSETVFNGGSGDSNGSYLKKKKLTETWDATMQIMFPGATSVMKHNRQFVGERITGTLSKTAFSGQDVDAIEFQVMHLNKLRERLKTEGIPAKDDDFGALIDIAFEEATFEWRAIHGQPIAEILDREPAGNEAEPF